LAACSAFRAWRDMGDDKQRQLVRAAKMVEMWRHRSTLAGIRKWLSTVQEIKQGKADMKTKMKLIEKSLKSMIMGVVATVFRQWTILIREKEQMLKNELTMQLQGFDSQKEILVTEMRRLKYRIEVLTKDRQRLLAQLEIREDELAGDPIADYQEALQDSEDAFMLFNNNIAFYIEDLLPDGSTAAKGDVRHAVLKFICSYGEALKRTFLHYVSRGSYKTDRATLSLGPNQLRMLINDLKLENEVGPAVATIVKSVKHVRDESGKVISKSLHEIGDEGMDLEEYIEFVIRVAAFLSRKKKDSDILESVSSFFSNYFLVKAKRFCVDKFVDRFLTCEEVASVIRKRLVLLERLFKKVAGKSNIAVETSTFNIPKYFQFCKDFKITNVRITIPKLLYIFIISNWDEETMTTWAEWDLGMDFAEFCEVIARIAVLRTSVVNFEFVWHKTTETEVADALEEFLAYLTSMDKDLKEQQPQDIRSPAKDGKKVNPVSARASKRTGNTLSLTSGVQAAVSQRSPQASRASTPRRFT